MILGNLKELRYKTVIKMEKIGQFCFLRRSALDWSLYVLALLYMELLILFHRFTQNYYVSMLFVSL